MRAVRGELTHAFPPVVNLLGSPTMFETVDNAKAVCWKLSGQIEESGTVRQIPICELSVSRWSQLWLSALVAVSKRFQSACGTATHRGRPAQVRDLSSTNGTFVNGVKIIAEAAVQSGDLLQFGNVIFQLFGADSSVAPDALTIETNASESALAMVQFDKLMNTRAVVPFFQPIVALASHESTACEVLGRSRLFGVRTPDAMFQAATRRHQETQLSRLLHSVGTSGRGRATGHAEPVLDTHPSELHTPGFVESLRDDLPDLRMTLEIHEAAVTESKQIRELRAICASLTSVWRTTISAPDNRALLELGDVVPDIMKFDMEFIRDIHLAPAERLKVVATLVRMSSELARCRLRRGSRPREKQRPVCS